MSHFRIYCSASFFFIFFFIFLDITTEEALSVHCLHFVLRLLKLKICELVYGTANKAAVNWVDFFGDSKEAELNDGY